MTKIKFDWRSWPKITNHLTVQCVATAHPEPGAAAGGIVHQGSATISRTGGGGDEGL